MGESLEMTNSLCSADAEALKTKESLCKLRARWLAIKYPIFILIFLNSFALLSSLFILLLWYKKERKINTNSNKFGFSRQPLAIINFRRKKCIEEGNYFKVAPEKAPIGAKSDKIWINSFFLSRWKQSSKQKAFVLEQNARLWAFFVMAVHILGFLWCIGKYPFCDLSF